MKTPAKIELLKSVKKLILSDWGRCKAKHLTWMCMSCLAGLTIDFLEYYIRQLEDD